MKIICEHCGTSIDLDKDKVCPNCKAPFSKNQDYNEYKERANKWASESVQQKIQSFLPNEGKEHDIFIAGGTSIALEFEDNFIKISDPQMATAQGAYYVATMLFE